LDWIRAALVECNRLSSAGDPVVAQSRFHLIYAHSLLRYGEISLCTENISSKDESRAVQDNIIDFFQAARDFAEQWALGSDDNEDFQIIFVKSLLYLSILDQNALEDGDSEIITRALPNAVNGLVLLTRFICSLGSCTSLIEQISAMILERLGSILVENNLIIKKTMAELLLWQSALIIDELEGHEEIDDESHRYKMLMCCLAKCMAILNAACPCDDPAIQWLLCEANLHLADWTFEGAQSDSYLQAAKKHAAICDSMDPLIIPADIRDALLES
jgi:hypothetical protein